MTKQLKLSALCIALLASVSAIAHEKPGYTIDQTTRAVTKNRYDECWKNTYFSEDNALPECGAPKEIEEKVITLQSKFLFGFDKYSLRPAAIETLNRIADQLKSIKIDELESVSVEGHTDFKGSYEYNQKLSERRAKAVANYLVKQGADPNKMTSIGFSKSKEVMSGPCQEQVKGIKNKAKRRLALIECIEPDRKVDIRIRGKSLSQVDKKTGNDIDVDIWKERQQFDAPGAYRGTYW